MNDDYYMNVALEQARKALEIDEIPVGAVIVENNKIISKGYNRKVSTGIVTKHAEVIAIEKACKKKKNWRLNDCILYVTLEPCPMCCGAIQQARFKQVVYGCHSNIKDNEQILNQILNNKNFNHQVLIKSDVLQEECSTLIKNFFNQKR